MKNAIRFLETYWAWIFFPGVLVMLLYFNFAAKGVYDSGDAIQHYMNAHDAFRHPDLFLNHWNKPLYTILMCVPAQAGYVGVCTLNILFFLSSAWFAWKIAAHWGWAQAPLAAVFTVFTPIAFGVAISGLTEPLFGFVLALSIYLIVKGKWRAAAIVISFLPFARTEGFFLLVLFGAYFLWRRDWISFLLAGTGTVLFSLIGGFFVYHDLLWVFTQNPYPVISQYGSGPLSHFFVKSEFIFGWPLSFLLVLGGLSYLLPFIRRNDPKPARLEEFLLVAGCFFVFFFAHVLFWWKGLCGSLGLERVMASVIPVAGIVAVRAIRTISSWMTKRQVIFMVFASGLVALHIVFPFKNMSLPFPLDPYGQTLQRTADFVRGQKLENNRSFIHYPYLRFMLDKDQYDPESCAAFWGIDTTRFFRKGDMILWDSHFNPSETHCGLDNFTLHPDRFELMYKDSVREPNWENEQFYMYVFRVRGNWPDTVQKPQ